MAAVMELQLLKSANEDAVWLKSHYKSLIGAYDNQFIAIKNRSVIAASTTLDGLFRELGRKRLDPAKLLVKHLSSAATIL